MEEAAGSNPASSTNLCYGFVVGSSGSVKSAARRAFLLGLSPMALGVAGSTRRGRWRTAGLVCWLPLLILGSAWGGAGAEAPQASPAPYDLTVVVLATGPGPTQVALSYSHQVDHDRLREAIRELCGLVNCQATEVAIRDEPLEGGSSVLCTSAEFGAAGLVRAGRGALPVGPVVRSLPEWRHLRLLFMAGENYPFCGPMDSMVDGFAVRLVNRLVAYEYDVELKGGRVVPPDESAPSDRPREPLLLSALLGAPSGFLFGLIVSTGQHRKSARRA